MSPRLRFRAVALAAAAAGGALAVLVLPAAPASAATYGAALTLNGASFRGAMVSVLTVSAGDSIVFSAGSDTLSVRLHAGSLPGGQDVTLNALKTETVSFGAAGSFAFSWTATPLIGRAVNQGASVQVAGPATSPPPSSPPPSSPPPSSSSAPGPSSSSSVGGGSTSRTPGASSSPAGFTASPDGGLVGLGSSAVDSASTAAAGSSASSGGHSNSAAAGGAAPSDTTPGAALQADIGHGSTSQPTALAIVSILALAGVLASYAYLYFGRRLTGQH